MSWKPFKTFLYKANKACTLILNDKIKNFELFELRDRATCQCGYFRLGRVILKTGVKELLKYCLILEIFSPKHLGLSTMHSKKFYRVANCQFYRIVTACQQVSTNLSISSSCNKSVKIRLIATCHLQTCYNLLKQLAASKWITSFDNQLATIKSADKLPQTFRQQAVASHANSFWYRLVDNKSVATHP